MTRAVSPRPSTPPHESALHFFVTRPYAPGAENALVHIDADERIGVCVDWKSPGRRLASPAALPCSAGPNARIRSSCRRLIHDRTPRNLPAATPTSCGGRLRWSEIRVITAMPSPSCSVHAHAKSDRPCNSTTHNRHEPTGERSAWWHNVGISKPNSRAASSIDKLGGKNDAATVDRRADLRGWRSIFRQVAPHPPGNPLRNAPGRS